MTRKDIQTVADIMREEEPSLNTELDAFDLWFRLITRFADELQKDNPRFNRHCFIKACYHPGDVFGKPRSSAL